LIELISELIFLTRVSTKMLNRCVDFVDILQWKRKFTEGVSFKHYWHVVNALYL